MTLLFKLLARVRIESNTDSRLILPHGVTPPIIIYMIFHFIFFILTKNKILFQFQLSQQQFSIYLVVNHYSKYQQVFFLKNYRLSPHECRETLCSFAFVN